MGDVFNQTLQCLGLTSDDVSKGTLRTGDKPGSVYLSSRPEFASALAAKPVVLNDLAHLKALTGTIDNGGANLRIPEPWTTDASTLKAHQLSEADEQNLYAALRACLAGRQDDVQSYADILDKRYFPMSVSAFASEDIVVTAGNPLIISPQGHDPVVVTCNSLTLEQGGQIICEAPVILTCNTFTKN